MKISEEHIQQLYLFTRQHFVEHYDLQTELVDHLANGIEKQWEESPNLSFEEARQKEFKKFGVCGFYDVIKDRHNAMAKKYRKFIFRYYREFFQLPKVLILLLLTTALFFLLQLIGSDYKFIFLTVFTLVFSGTFLLYNYLNKKKQIGKNGANEKKWLMEEMITNLGNGTSLAVFPLYLFNLFPESHHRIDNIYVELGICAFICSYLTLCYVMCFVIPKKAEQLLIETYPEYRMV